MGRQGTTSDSNGSNDIRYNVGQEVEFRARREERTQKVRLESRRQVAARNQEEQAQRDHSEQTERVREGMYRMNLDRDGKVTESMWVSKDATTFFIAESCIQLRTTSVAFRPELMYVEAGTEVKVVRVGTAGQVIQIHLGQVTNGLVCRYSTKLRVARNEGIYDQREDATLRRLLDLDDKPI